MIFITGGAGYIGSHCALELIKNNFEVCVFDNLSTGHIETIHTLKKFSNANYNFIKGDLKNFHEIDNALATYKPDVVLHFAAYSQVGESVEYPEKYYTNNVIGTINLLNSMLHNGIKQIIFSSTAAVYGEPIYLPIDEKHPANPINPYGKTKFLIENILDDYDMAYGLKSVRFRYFNVAGADEDGIIGEWHEPETHLIPNILKSTLGKNFNLSIFGTDYNTKDGTCVRDYININDLVQAHLAAIKYLKDGGKTDYFNLGTKYGASIKEILDTCKKVTNKDIKANYTDRRKGDPALLIADNNKAEKILKWSPKHTLEDSIKSAYKWELHLNSYLESLK